MKVQLDNDFVSFFWRTLTDVKLSIVVIIVICRKKESLAKESLSQSLSTNMVQLMDLHAFMHYQDGVCLNLSWHDSSLFK